MNSSGVPTSQGVTIADATTAKKRGTRSEGKPTGYTFGKGTAGKRLKSAWKKSKTKESLLTFARGLVKSGVKAATSDGDSPAQDAKTWLERKGKK